MLKKNASHQNPCWKIIEFYKFIRRDNIHVFVWLQSSQTGEWKRLCGYHQEWIKVQCKGNEIEIR